MLDAYLELICNELQERMFHCKVGTETGVGWLPSSHDDSPGITLWPVAPSTAYYRIVFHASQVIIYQFGVNQIQQFDYADPELFDKLLRHIRGLTKF